MLKSLTEDVYNEWRDIFFDNIEDELKGDEMIDYLDDEFEEWLGVFYDANEVPSYRQVMVFAWKINGELAEKEASALSIAKGD